MADETRDQELSRRYRELPREEPGAELDAAILAAARRAAETRPAPLVPPTARRRWYFPLAAAAILVLAVAVTLQVERNQPDVDELGPRTGTAVPAAPQPTAPPAPSPAPRAKERKASAPDVAQEAPAKVEAFSRAAPAPEQQAAPAAQGPLNAEEGSAQASAGVAGRRDMAGERQVPASVAASAPAHALAKLESPEQALERIAELRRQGKDEEADKALAEFRKRYPDFRISEEMLKKVERRPAP